MRTEIENIGPTEDCPHPEWWSARDAEASEVETGDLLYGLVRILKPQVVLETGCYLGDTSVRIAHGLYDNSKGYLWTCDTLPDRVEAANRELEPYKAFAHASVRQGVELCREIPDVDLAFIDSNGDRIEELKSLRMRSNGFIVLHDSRWKVFAAVRELGWKEIFFPTPRGVSLFQV